MPGHPVLEGAEAQHRERQQQGAVGPPEPRELGQALGHELARSEGEHRAAKRRPGCVAPELAEARDGHGKIGRRRVERPPERIAVREQAECHEARDRGHGARLAQHAPAGGEDQEREGGEQRDRREVVAKRGGVEAARHDQRAPLARLSPAQQSICDQRQEQGVQAVHLRDDRQAPERGRQPERDRRRRGDRGPHTEPQQ